jgi:serine O-acetyltransferase
MIQSKEDLQAYLKADKVMCDKANNLIVKWITRSDDLYIRAFMVALRHYEYWLNKKRNLFEQIPFLFWWWNYRRLRLKSGLGLPPNVAGPGFFPVHPGFLRIGEYVTIGKNCTVLPMVLIGKRLPEIDSKIRIGDNCYISTGVTIIGPVTIGNNVTIGAGAVVTKDVPDNALVTGIPGKVMKIKDENTTLQ